MAGDVSRDQTPGLRLQRRWYRDARVRSHLVRSPRRDTDQPWLVWIRLDARSRIRDDGKVGLPLADDETFHRAAELVGALAAHHGLSEVRLGQYSGELVVTVSADRDYFDLVRFEMELGNLLRARVRVVSGGAPGVRARGPLRQDRPRSRRPVAGGRSAGGAARSGEAVTGVETEGANGVTTVCRRCLRRRKGHILSPIPI
jgi:hypothetical protein